MNGECDCHTKNEKLKEAWKIINILNMENLASPDKEAWPRAWGWLEENKEFKPDYNKNNN